MVWVVLLVVLVLYLDELIYKIRSWAVYSPSKLASTVCLTVDFHK